MSLLIASQMGDHFNARLRAHPSRPTVIAAPEAQPWAAASEADVFLVWPSPSWRDAPPRPSAWPGRLKWVCFASTGVDFYPRWLLEAPISNCARGVASEEIADYVIAALYRQAKDLDRVRARSPEDWKPAALGQLAGSVVGILGLGAIGCAVARRALSLGCRVTAARRRDLPSPVDGVAVLDSMQAVVATADHIVLALPSTDATRGLIDAELLAHAKSTAHVVNVGRGAVLDHQALLCALDAGRLGYATLDVTEPEPLPAGHPLWTHPQVCLTPHVAANHSVSQDAFFEKAVRDLERFISGEAPSDLVDPLAGY